MEILRCAVSESREWGDREEEKTSRFTSLQRPGSISSDRAISLLHRSHGVDVIVRSAKPVK